MGRFDTNHDWVKSFAPFSEATGDQGRLINGLLSGLREDNKANSALWEALALATAEEENLDLFGDVLGVQRNPDEDDADYRDRLIIARRARAHTGTPDSIHQAVYAILGNHDHGIVYHKDRAIHEGALLDPSGYVTPISDHGLFSYAIFLPELTDNQLDELRALLREIAPARDRIILAQVDEDTITPATIDGTATASSETAGHEATKAIDGALGSPVGPTAFYWDTDDIPPDPDEPPWWKVELDEPQAVDLLMINQQCRADVGRLKDVRITLSGPYEPLVYTCRLPYVDDYERWYFPLPRPCWVHELKIEVLSAYDDDRDYLSLGEVEIYGPDDWAVNVIGRIHG